MTFTVTRISLDRFDLWFPKENEPGLILVTVYDIVKISIISFLTIQHDIAINIVASMASVLATLAGSEHFPEPVGRSILPDVIKGEPIRSSAGFNEDELADCLLEVMLLRNELGTGYPCVADSSDAIPRTPSPQPFTVPGYSTEKPSTELHRNPIFAGCQTLQTAVSDLVVWPKASGVVHTLPGCQLFDLIPELISAVHGRPKLQAVFVQESGMESAAVLSRRVCLWKPQSDNTTWVLQVTTDLLTCLLCTFEALSVGSSVAVDKVRKMAILTRLGPLLAQSPLLKTPFIIPLIHSLLQFAVQSSSVGPCFSHCWSSDLPTPNGKTGGQ